MINRIRKKLAVILTMIVVGVSSNVIWTNLQNNENSEVINTFPTSSKADLNIAPYNVYHKTNYYSKKKTFMGIAYLRDRHPYILLNVFDSMIFNSS